MALSPSSVSVCLFLSPKALLCLCVSLSMALCLSFLPIWLFPCFGPAEVEKPAIIRQQCGTFGGLKSASTFKDRIHRYYRLWTNWRPDLVLLWVWSVNWDCKIHLCGSFQCGHSRPLREDHLTPTQTPQPRPLACLKLWVLHRALGGREAAQQFCVAPR